MLHQHGEFDVCLLAQDVVDAWGMHVQDGKGEALSADFKALFEFYFLFRAISSRFLCVKLPDHSRTLAQ
jgi:hypothetical protein